MAGDAPPAGRVLVVEDNAVNRMAVARGVEREGHDVVTAENGREALEQLRADPQGIALVLLDLVMPEVDGFQVLDEMHRDPALRDVPVLVISAVEETESIARAIEMGAIDCLPKPFDPVLLRARLRTALQQRHLRRLEQDFLRQELALRQHEKLVTLGRLSAGLAHELNNPAGAALRSARQLEERLTNAAELIAGLAAASTGQQAIEAAAAIDELVGSAPADAGVRAEAEDDIEALLERHDIADPWAFASDLAEAGLTAERLGPWLERLPPDAADGAVAWLATRVGIARNAADVVRSVERISELVGALRSYSYLDRGTRQRVDVRTGLDDTLAMLAHRIPAGVHVERDYAADLPPVAARGGELNQVWTNLIDNALDALGAEGTLRLRARAEGGEVVVDVEDDGPGIPPELIGEVFDPFVTTKAPGEGTGLGLNIAHQIVTTGHGGRLGVESAPGRTVFTVRLPIEAASGAT